MGGIKKIYHLNLVGASTVGGKSIKGSRKKTSDFRPTSKTPGKGSGKGQPGGNLPGNVTLITPGKGSPPPKKK